MTHAISQLHRTAPHRASGWEGAIVGVLVIGIALMAVHAVVPTRIPTHLRTFAALPGVAAVLLWGRYFASRDFERVPFLEFSMTQVYLLWGLPAVTLDPREMPDVSGGALASAVVGGCLVAALVLLVHPVSRTLGTRVTLQRFLPRTAPELGPLVILPWLTVALVVHARVAERYLPPEAQQIALVLGSYPPLLACIAWRDCRRRRWSGMFVFCVGALSAAGFLTGMMEAVAQPLLAAALLHVVFRRRIPWGLVLAGVFVVVVLNSAKHHYRDMAWDPTDPGSHVATNPIVAAERWGKAIELAWMSPGSARARHAGTLASRLDELSVNAVCFEHTPGSVPYDKGKNWAFMPLSLVPRILLRDKPSTTVLFNDRFNVTFGFQTWDSTEHSTGAFPLVADGYWNFGWLGVVIAGVAVGGVIGLFAGALRATSWAMASIAVSAFVNLHATYDLGSQVSGILQRVLGTALACWAVWLVSAIVHVKATPVAHEISEPS